MLGYLAQCQATVVPKITEPLGQPFTRLRSGRLRLLTSIHVNPLLTRANKRRYSVIFTQRDICLRQYDALYIPVVSSLGLAPSG
jgi:hypothetical protein